MEKIARDVDEELIEQMQAELKESLTSANINEEDILQKARDNLMIWDGYFNENVVRGRSDMNFVLRDQWTALDRSEFTRTFKPALTFNKLYDATKKIAGEQRKNKPDLLVRSLTGKATQEEINLRADLVRTISYQSQNDLIYQSAFKSALMLGYGAFDIVLDYETPRSFNQVIRYEMIPDATRTSFDPSAIKPHKGDGNFCAKQYIYTKEQFYATFPHIELPVSYSDPRSLLDFQWATRDTITVCKYTQKEWYPMRILQLSDGRVVTEEEWEDLQKQYEMHKELARGSLVVGDMITNEIPTVHSDRKTQDYIINQYLLTQNQIIEYTPWPSKYLNLIFVDGDSHFIDGMQYTHSYIHEAKDSQKFVNYVGSEVAAEIKNRRREQWLVTPDNIIGNEQMWRVPEVQNGALVARPDPKTGMMPQKLPPWEMSQSLLLQYQRGNQDMREILGMSETEALQGRDMSGKARRERKMEGSMSAYVFFDNLNQAIEQSGRVVLDLLPYIVGENERAMTIKKPDGRTDSIVLNQQLPNGDIKNKIEQGDYDVEIDTGPSFSVQKDVALEFFQQTIANNPEVFPLIADLWAGNLDIQQMPLVKERLKNLVPPEILAKEEGKPPPPKQPNPQEQMAQAQLQLQQAQIQEAQAAIQIKAQELELKKQKMELDKAEMILRAQKDKMDAQLNVFDHKANIQKSMITHGLDQKKAENDFTHKIAGVLASLHEGEQQREHERQLHKNKSNSDSE